jgi:hypothetical protein
MGLDSTTIFAIVVHMLLEHGADVTVMPKIKMD